MLKRALKLTEEDKIFARAVKERDGWQCVICGDMERLNAHHLLPRENHETKYDIMNGLTLCSKHHFFSRIISGHNNPIALFFWLEKYRPETIIYLKEEMEKILNGNKE